MLNNRYYVRILFNHKCTKKVKKIIAAIIVAKV